METGVRLLGRADTAAVRALCDRDPVSNVFVAGRLQAAGSAEPGALGGQLWGFHEDGRLVSALFCGANVIPVAPTPAAVEAFGRQLNSSPRRSSSLVGPAPAVLDLAERLQAWSRPREIRSNQLLMVLNGPPQVPPDPAVTHAREEDADALFPASVAMFTEEVGYSPIGADGGTDYRRRVEYLIQRRYAFARFEDDLADWPGPGRRQVVFKADVGVCSSDVAQIQGVWVHPLRRGRGLTAPAMAAVALAVRREVAPLVSLYVNDFNERAVAAYRRVGFRQVGTFATVLF